MAIEIVDLLDKGVRGFNFSRPMWRTRNALGTQQFIWYFEVKSKLFVCQNDVIGLVHNQNAINCRLGLRLQQCSLEQQSFFSLFAFGDVVKGSDKAPVARAIG